MPSSTAIPRDDAGKLALLQHLRAHLPNYAAALEISAEDMAQLQSGLDWFDYSLKAQDAAKIYTDALFTFKRALRDGPKNAALQLPPQPVWPAAPGAAPYADIFGFLGGLIARVKRHKNYTESIGKALNIIAAQGQSYDPTSLQPVLTVDFQGGHPVLHWKNNGADALELQAGSGSFSLLTINMSPGYQDNTPPPSPRHRRPLEIPRHLPHPRRASGALEPGVGGGGEGGMKICRGMFWVASDVDWVAALSQPNACRQMLG